MQNTKQHSNHSSFTKWAPTLAILATILFWGISFISIKIAVAEVPPFTLALLRFIIASVILFPIFKRYEPGTKFNKKDIPLLALGGLVGITLYFSFENPGVKYTTASSASMIVAVIPALAVLMDFLIFKNRITWMKSLGVIISIIGVYYVATSNSSIDFTQSTFKGNILMILADITWIGYLIVNKFLEGKYSDLAITAFQSVAGGIFLIPLSLNEYSKWGRISTSSWLHILFLAVCCSAIAYFLYIYSIRKLGVSITSTYLNLIPVIGAASGYLVLGEKITSAQIMGGIMIIIGVMIVNKKESKKEIMVNVKEGNV